MTIFIFNLTLSLDECFFGNEYSMIISSVLPCCSHGLNEKYAWLQGNILCRDQQSGLFAPCFTANLQYLRLGDNNIHSVPSEALRRLRRLRHLDLRSNNISNISDDAFYGFGDTVSFLNLQKNE